MVLGAAIGAGAGLVGAGLQLAGAKKREDALGRVQKDLERHNARFFGERTKRGDVLQRLFEGLAARSGGAMSDFLAARASGARVAAGAGREADTMERAAQSREDVLSRLLPEPSVAAPTTHGMSQQAQMQEFVPALDAQQELVGSQAEQRGRRDFVEGQRGVLAERLAAMRRRAADANRLAGVADASQQVSFDRGLSRLQDRQRSAGEQGGGLMLAGSLLQNIGTGASSFLANRE